MELMKQQALNFDTRVIGDDIVRVARAWIGTPYRHQGSCRGAGADCLGLIRGIWREVYGQEPEAVPSYTPDWGEPTGEEVLWSAAGRHLQQRSAGDPSGAGDLLLFRMRQAGIAKHVAVRAEAVTAR